MARQCCGALCALLAGRGSRLHQRAHWLGHARLGWAESAMCGRWNLGRVGLAHSFLCSRPTVGCANHNCVPGLLADGDLVYSREANMDLTIGERKGHAAVQRAGPWRHSAVLHALHTQRNPLHCLLRLAHLPAPLIGRQAICIRGACSTACDCWLAAAVTQPVCVVVPMLW